LESNVETSRGFTDCRRGGWKGSFFGSCPSLVAAARPASEDDDPTSTHGNAAALGHVPRGSRAWATCQHMDQFDRAIHVRSLYRSRHYSHFAPRRERVHSGGSGRTGTINRRSERNSRICTSRDSPNDRAWRASELLTRQDWRDHQYGFTER